MKDKYRHRRAHKRKMRHRRRRLYTKIAVGLLSFLFVLVLAVGLAAAILYKSGEASLRASAATKKPIVESDLQAVERLRADYGYQNTVPWEEDWVVYEDEVYTYEEDALNFLVLGIDRSGEIEKETDLSDWSAGQADAIFLVSLDNKDKKASIIGIPRNAMVQVDIYNGQNQRVDTIYNQICLQYGYAGGGENGLLAMKERVSALFYQLPIHGVCAIGFDAMGVIADKLEGITVTIPDDMTGLRADFIQGARIRLTGNNVLAYLRYREYAVLGSPTTRLSRQKEFLKEAIRTAVAQIRREPALVGDIYKAVTPYMNTDISLDEAVYLATRVLEYQVQDSAFYQLAGRDEQVDFVGKDGTKDFYDDYYLDEASLKKTVMEVFYRKVVWEGDGMSQ